MSSTTNRGAWKGQSGAGMLGLFSNPAIQASNGRRGPYQAKAGSFIRKQRLSKGLTQPEAAKFCSVGLRTFQRAESGDVVDISTKRSIERRLGAAW